MDELRALIKSNPKVSFVPLLALLVFGMTQNPQFLSHVMDIIRPSASRLMSPWVSHVSVNAMLSALELENDITVARRPLLQQNLPAFIITHV
jgi:hypothetical protein